jgi:hypothetical protein
MYPYPRGLLRLPAEIIYMILSHLSPRDLYNFGQLSRATRRLVYQGGRLTAPATYWMVRNLLQDVYHSEDLDPAWLFDDSGHD